MQPYSSARTEFKQEADIYLDANESPFMNGVNRYPDPCQLKLKQKLSGIKNLPMEQILLGNGSDEIIDLVFRAFGCPGKDSVLITPPTYGMYRVLAQLNDLSCIEIPLLPGFSLDMQEIYAVSNQAKIVMLCSPNNPSGNKLRNEDIEQIARRSPGIVFIDEAYIDFSEQESWIRRLDIFPNLVVCQTLSKAWGMAGLRLGMCFASAEIIRVLNKIKPPYNIGKQTQEKALELLDDMQGFKKRLLYLRMEKQRLAEQLKVLPEVLSVYASDANFLLVRFTDSRKVYNYLTASGIVTRNHSSQHLCTNCLRITIGLKSENDRLINALEKIKL